MVLVSNISRPTRICLVWLVLERCISGFGSGVYSIMAHFVLKRSTSLYADPPFLLTYIRPLMTSHVRSGISVSSSRWSIIRLPGFDTLTCSWPCVMCMFHYLFDLVRSLFAMNAERSERSENTLGQKIWTPFSSP